MSFVRNVGRTSDSFRETMRAEQIRTIGPSQTVARNGIFATFGMARGFRRSMKKSEFSLAARFAIKLQQPPFSIVKLIGTARHANSFCVIGSISYNASSNDLPASQQQ